MNASAGIKNTLRHSVEMSDTTADTKVEAPKVAVDTKTDTKFVRPKRRYIKKKDRLQGIIVKHEPVVIRFD